MSNNNINTKYEQVNDPHNLGIIDRFIRTLRGMINKYQSAYKTTRYINILDELVENYNNSYHSGIQRIPNKPDENKLKRVQFKKYVDGIKQDTKYIIKDNVRFLKNKVILSKGSLLSWSSTIHKIENKNLHSYIYIYILDNGKTYKYYELQKDNNVQGYGKEHINEPHVRL